MSQMDDIRDKVVQAWDLIHKRHTISTRDNWSSNCGPCMVSNEVLDVDGMTLAKTSLTIQQIEDVFG